MTNTAPGDRRLLATFSVPDAEGVVRVEDRLEAAVDDVWAALTEVDRLARWLGDFEGEVAPGGEFRARFHATGWEGAGRVGLWEKPNRLRFLTKEPDDPAETQIDITLTPAGAVTIVTWEESGKPEQLLPAYAAGIQIHVEDLADYVAGRESRDARSGRFNELFDAYKEVAAATER